MSCDITEYDFVVRWEGKKYQINAMSENESVSELKNKIYLFTGVLPGRQRLTGLGKDKKISEDHVLLKNLKLKKVTGVTMVGPKEETLFQLHDDEEEEEEQSTPTEAWSSDNPNRLGDDLRRKILKRIQDRVDLFDTESRTLNEPEGKKLLVLDLDFTLIDHRTQAEFFEDVCRPYLHEFMEAAYQNYDIIIWSAQNYNWIERKLGEMDCLDNENFKIVCILDSQLCIPVHLPMYGPTDVKPLDLVWKLFPDAGWGPENTLIIDDLRRHFTFNPKQGLKVKSYTDAKTMRKTDAELLKLNKYITDIADVEDFTHLDHKKWMKYKKPKPEDGDAQSQEVEQADGEKTQ